MLKPYLPLIGALAALILVTTFALKNRLPVPVWLFGDHYIPLVVVILGSFVVGIVLGVGLSLRRQFYLAGRIRDLETALTGGEVAAAEAAPAGAPASGQEGMVALHE